MAWRVVDEDVELPERLLRHFAVVVLPLLVFPFVMQSPGFLEGVGVWFLALCLIVRCLYSVNPENKSLLLRFRLWLSGIVGVSSAILNCFDGVAVLRFDIPNALIFGIVAAVSFHLSGILVSVICGPILNLMRRFRRPNECRQCGYDLSGTPGDRCSECGNAIGPYQRLVLNEIARKSGTANEETIH